jgi:excisionase family DNA binding protein
MPSRLLGRWVVVCDHAQRYVAVSDDVALMLGWRPRDLIGVSAWETTTRPEPERPAIVEQLATTGAVSGTSQWLTRDGRHVDTAYSARVVNGGELYVVHAAPPGELLRLRADGAARAIQPHHDPDAAWLTKAEAADYARCSTATIERAVHDRKLRTGGTGGLRLFRREWLDAWLGLVVVVLVTLAALWAADIFDAPIRLPSMAHRTHHLAAHHRVGERREHGHEDEQKQRHSV